MSLVAIGACYLDTILTLVGASTLSSHHFSNSFFVLAPPTTQEKMTSYGLRVSPIDGEVIAQTLWKF